MEFMYPPHLANPYSYDMGYQEYGWAQQEYAAGYHGQYPAYYPHVGGTVWFGPEQQSKPQLSKRKKPEPAQPVTPPRKVYTEDILKGLQGRGRNPARTVIACDVYVPFGTYATGAPQPQPHGGAPAEAAQPHRRHAKHAQSAGGAGRAGNRPNPRGGGAPHRDHSAVCLDFLKGVCNDKRYKCKYVHPPMPIGPTLVEAAGESMESRQEVCDVWVLTGFCKFGEKCRFYHPILDESATPVCSPAITMKMVPPRAKGRFRHPRSRTTFESAVADHSDESNESNPEDASTPEDAGTPQHSPIPSPTHAAADDPATSPLSPLGLGLDVTVRRINGILNRITAEKFGSLSQQLLEMVRQSEACLTRALPLVFAKGCAEEQHGEIYAQVCKCLYEDATPPQRATIGTTLLQLGSRLLYNIDEVVIALAGQEEQLSRLQAKRIGNIRFLGELFLEGLLHLNSVLEVITFLEKKAANHADKADAALHTELLCKFLSTIGERVDADYPGAFDIYYRNLQHTAARYSTRVQVLIQNLVEWRHASWRC